MPLQHDGDQRDRAETRYLGLPRYIGMLMDSSITAELPELVSEMQQSTVPEHDTFDLFRQRRKEDTCLICVSEGGAPA